MITLITIEDSDIKDYLMDLPVSLRVGEHIFLDIIFTEQGHVQSYFEVVSKHHHYDSHKGYRQILYLRQTS